MTSEFDTAIAEAAPGSRFRARTRVTAHLDCVAIDGLLFPAHYTGLCAQLARQAADRAREAAVVLT